MIIVRFFCSRTIQRGESCLSLFYLPFQRASTPLRWGEGGFSGSRGGVFPLGNGSIWFKGQGRLRICIWAWKLRPELQVVGPGRQGGGFIERGAF